MHNSLAACPLPVLYSAGGAVAAVGLPALEVSGSRFEGNTASAAIAGAAPPRGGALALSNAGQFAYPILNLDYPFLGPNANVTNATVVGCVFAGNKAAEGGAVSSDDNVELTLLATTFDGNRATAMGGALALFGVPYDQAAAAEAEAQQQQQRLRLRRQALQVAPSPRSPPPVPLTARPRPPRPSPPLSPPPLPSTKPPPPRSSPSPPSPSPNPPPSPRPPRPAKPSPPPPRPAPPPPFPSPPEGPMPPPPGPEPPAPPDAPDLFNPYSLILADFNDYANRDIPYNFSVFGEEGAMGPSGAPRFDDALPPATAVAGGAVFRGNRAAASGGAVAISGAHVFTASDVGFVGACRHPREVPSCAGPAASAASSANATRTIHFPVYLSPLGLACSLARPFSAGNTADKGAVLFLSKFTDPGIPPTFSRATASGNVAGIGGFVFHEVRDGMIPAVLVLRTSLSEQAGYTHELLSFQLLHNASTDATRRAGGELNGPGANPRVRRLPGARLRGCRFQLRAVPGHVPAGEAQGSNE